MTESETTPEFEPYAVRAFKELVVAQLALWDAASRLEGLLGYDIDLGVLGDVACGFDDACDVRGLSEKEALATLRAFLSDD